MPQDQLYTNEFDRLEGEVEVGERCGN